MYQQNMDVWRKVISLSSTMIVVNPTPETNTDIITALDDNKITSFSEIYQVLEKHSDGDKVKLKFYRPSDGENYEIEITLQADK